jgi:ribosome-binding protein aMBF1 (putative translation factor)
MPLSPAQCRAARALLNWSPAQLAQKAGVAQALLEAFEDEQAMPTDRSTDRIRLVLERAGIELLDGAAPGVRLHPRPAVLSLEELNASNDE